MTFTPRMPDHVRNLPPYVPGRPAGSVAREFGLSEDRIIKLASNENPLGMSPAAKEAIADFVGDVARYPDPDGHDLKAALAAAFDVKPDWLTLGNGSSEILEMACRAFLGAGQAGVISQYSFVVYRAAIQTVGARIITVPARDLAHDLDGLAAAARADGALVFLANPNNPTGTFFTQDAFIRFLSAVPEHTIVVLDEAYQEYLKPEERFASVDLVRWYPNLIVTRSFSKAYGLAGLRVGFAIARPELTDALNRVRPVFNVNVLGQAAARAALGDKEFLEKSRRLNDEGLAYLEDFCRSRGLVYTPSKGNFVLVEVPNAADANRRLLQRGVVVRPVGNYGLASCLRVSIGLPEENRSFANAMDEVLGRPSAP